MDFVSIVVQLKHKPARSLSIADARFAHGAVMHAISRADEDAGRILHDTQRFKPMTLSIMSAKRTSAILRVTFIDCAAMGYANLLLSDWIRNPLIRLGDLDCEIDGVETSLHPWSGAQSWDGLIRARLVGKSFAMEFCTPTVINKTDDQRQRFAGLLPDPESIFSGLFRKWQQLDGPVLPVKPIDYIQSGGLVVSNYKIHTVSYELPRYKQLGFVGKVTYEFRKDDEQYMNTIYSLAQFSYYSGVGYHTAQGMGAVRVREDGAHA